MKLRQKVTVGSFLCLSLVVIAMALVSVSDLPRMNAIDAPVYILFWQYMKASVAILMASLTAFPNMFALQKEKKTREERMKRPVYSWQNWGHRTKSNDAEEGLPEVQGR
jgi:amino acid permease